MPFDCIARPLHRQFTINPKDAVYGSMPLFYAGGLVIVALAFNRASAWAARQAPPQP